MPTTKQPTVLISADVVQGMIAVLQAASTNGTLAGRERKLAAAYGDVLGKSLATKEGKAKVGMSVGMIANTLRIILMVIKPDPIVKALIEFIGHTL